MVNMWRLIIMYEIITAIYEEGVLRPLQPISFKPHQKVRMILEPNVKWCQEWKRLIESVYRRTSKFSSLEIEDDITIASQRKKNAN